MLRNSSFASLAGWLLLLPAASALAGDGVSVNITNDGTEDIVVTVYDTTLGPNAVVISHMRLNGFTTVPVSLSPDDTGLANIAWTATTADSRDRRCGHSSNTGLSDSASVNVRADSSCGPAQAGPVAVNFIR